jgi:hypothetical protein
MGHLWEHFVLNEMHGVLCPASIQYWRDKRGHEIDFIYCKRRRSPAVIECKGSSADFDPKNPQAFRRHYHAGPNFVVANDITRAYDRDYSGVNVQFVDLAGLLQHLASVV